MKTSTQIVMGLAAALAWFLGTGGILFADNDPPPPRSPIKFPSIPLAPAPCNTCEQSDRAACGNQPSLCALRSSATVALYCCIETATAPEEQPADFRADVTPNLD